MSGTDMNLYVSFEETAPLLARARQLEASGDEASRKEVSETIAAIRHSDELLKAAGESFLKAAKILRTTANLPADSSMHFVKRLVSCETEGGPESGGKALMAFASRLEEVRCGQGGVPRPDWDASTLDLADLNRIVAARNDLIGEYRILFSEIYRQTRKEGEFVKRLELDRRSVLVDIVNRAVDPASPLAKPDLEEPEARPSTRKNAPMPEPVIPLPEVVASPSEVPPSPLDAPPQQDESIPSPVMDSPVGLEEGHSGKSHGLDLPVPAPEAAPEEENTTPVDPDVPRISNPVAIRQSGNLRLTWDWPEGIVEVAVLWSHKASPQSPKDKLASREIVPKSQYDRHGAFVIRSCGNSSYHFSLFARVQKDGADVYSQGVECVSAEMQARLRISYRFRKRRKWLLLGPVEGVDLVIKSPGPFPLPALTVMKKRSGQPLGRFDGEHVSTIKNVRKRRMVFPLPVSKTDSGFYLKLFADDDASEAFISFIPPPYFKTRI